MSSDKPCVQFGILGCAGIARKLSRAIAISPNSILHAISSRSIDKTKRFAVENGVPETVKVYGSYDDLLNDPAVDAVYIPLPTSLHLHWAVMAAQKKKHVLLEKPTALDVVVVELDRILEACESNGVQFMDGSMWYHHPRTARMMELISDPRLFGQGKLIYSTSSYLPPEFLANDIRTKPDLDALGALGDAGWYCIGAIMWAMNHKSPTTVTALPSLVHNSPGVIMTCAASMNWKNKQTTASFYCSFLSHESMDISISGSNGSLHLKDLIIPYEETRASFKFTSGAKFADLHIGWNVREEEVLVELEIPQEAMMIREFSRLVEGIKFFGSRPDPKWSAISKATQSVLDAVMKSVETGFKPVHM